MKLDRLIADEIAKHTLSKQRNNTLIQKKKPNMQRKNLYYQPILPLSHITGDDEVLPRGNCTDEQWDNAEFIDKQLKRNEQAAKRAKRGKIEYGCPFCMGKRPPGQTSNLTRHAYPGVATQRAIGEKGTSSGSSGCRHYHLVRNEFAKIGLFLPSQTQKIGRRMCSPM